MNIDVHAHYVPRSVVDALDSSGEWHGIKLEEVDGQIVSTTPAARFPLPWPNFRAPITDRLEEMDRIRVDMQIISLTPTLWRHELPGEQMIPMAREVNDETAAISREHPERFRGFAFLPLQDTDGSVRELERAMTELDLVGAAVTTNVAGTDWDDDRLFPILEAAERLNAFLFVHPADVRTRKLLDRYHLRNSIGNPLETTIAIASLVYGGVLDRLPNLKLCFAHGGGYAVFAAGRFDHGYEVRSEARASVQRPPSDYLRSMYFDCLTHSPIALRHLVDLVGIEQVVLGSDFPADMGYRDPVGWLERAPLLDEAEKEQIRGGNLERLLGLRPAAPTAASA